MIEEIYVPAVGKNKEEDILEEIDKIRTTLRREAVESRKLRTIEKAKEEISINLRAYRISRLEAISKCLHLEAHLLEKMLSEDLAVLEKKAFAKIQSKAKRASHFLIFIWPCYFLFWALLLLNNFVVGYYVGLIIWGLIQMFLFIIFSDSPCRVFLKSRNYLLEKGALDE